MLQIWGYSKMSKQKAYLLLVLLLFPVSVWCQTSLPTGKTKSKFWGMKGNLITHFYSDSEDSSPDRLYELRNKKGLTLWYGKEVYDEVCLTGLCKVVHVWIFWDCVGNYLGLELFEEKPLTKTNHNVFSSEDYARLEQILSDSTSIFRELNYEDLIDLKEREQVLNVDGFSGATVPSLRYYAVDQAIYTCYSLWNVVYGESRKKIAMLNHERVDERYILKLFKQKETCYSLLALGLASKSEEWLSYQEKVLSLLSSDQNIISSRAFEVVKGRLSTNENLQIELVHKMQSFSSNLKTSLIWRLKEIPNVHENVIRSLLYQFEKEVVNPGSLGIIYEMVKPSHLQNKDILYQLKKNSTSENTYVRRITQKLLGGLLD